MKEKTNISSHVIDAIKEVTKDFLIVLFVITVPLFIYLKIGISIDKFAFKHYKVDGLYIKLDKKFILKAKKIHIPKTKAKPSFGSVEKTFNNIKEVLDFFEYIELNDVEFENNNLTILYSDHVFYLSSKEYELSSIIHKNKDIIDANITNLHINRSNIDIYGSLSYNTKYDILNTHGNFSFLDSNGTFTMVKDKKDLSLSLGSGNFTQLDKLLQAWKIPHFINVWLVDKIKAKSYKLDYFNIYASIDKNGALKANFKTINAKAVLKNVDIHFKDGVNSLNAKEVDIIYKDNNLSFDIYKPLYKGRDLNGSKVVISNLIGKNSAVLNIDLYINSPIDKEVANILKAYHLKLPVYTKSMQKFHIYIKKPLYPKSHIEVIVDSNLSKGKFYIGQVPLEINSGHIKFQNKKLKLSNIKLKNNIYNIKTNGDIDITQKKVNLKNYIYNLNIKDKNKNKFISIHNKKIPIKIDYKSYIGISLPTLDINLKKTKKQTVITIPKISKLLPYLKNLPLNIYDGQLKIYTKNFIKYRFEGVLKWKDCFFYQKHNACFIDIPCNGSIDNKNFQLYAFDKKLYINSAKSIIKLNNINIDLDKFFNANLKKVAKEHTKTYIYGNNSNIKYKNYLLVTDSYDITIYPDGHIKAIGSLDNDIIKFDKNGKNISIKAYRVTDKMLHPLINFDGLKQGRYTIKIEGNPDKELNGEILVEGGVLKDFKAYSNTLAFINSIPALATFSNPGFSSKGYIIKEGMITYRKTKDKIYLDSIYIKGSSANIAGKGIIDLKNRTLNISLAIQVAKDFGKVISKIPIVGYILMGDDQSITLGLKIKGSLDKPKVKTSVAKDILSLPLDMLKRTFGQ